jgi:hypothetical protein
MADVSGPVRTLPGSSHKVPEGMICDVHSDLLATHRIQGETDSFGVEYIDMCKECHDGYLSYKVDEDSSGICDWCRRQVAKRSKTRDLEEGSCGRVYDVCPACIGSRND